MKYVCIFLRILVDAMGQGSRLEGLKRGNQCAY